MLAEALALVAGMPAADEYEQMMWLLRRFLGDKRPRRASSPPSGG